MAAGPAPCYLPPAGALRRGPSGQCRGDDGGVRVPAGVPAGRRRRRPQRARTRRGRTAGAAAARPASCPTATASSCCCGCVRCRNSRRRRRWPSPARRRPTCWRPAASSTSGRSRCASPACCRASSAGPAPRPGRRYAGLRRRRSAAVVACAARAAASRVSRSSVTGLLRWASKPASSARRLSLGRPKPVSAMTGVSRVRGSRRRAAISA